MKRRDFLKLAAAAGIGTTIPEELLSILAGQAFAAAVPDLMVAQGNAATGKIIRAAVEGCGGIKKFISRGGIVVVKPNIGWDRKPEIAANTTPDVVAEIIKLCIEAGAKTQGLAGLTLSLKNFMGIMGGSCGRIHQNIDESLIDAVHILTANGPQGGNAADVKVMNTIVAGTDMVSINAFGTTLFGKKTSDLGCLRVAQKRNFERSDLQKMNIKRVKA